MSPPRRILVIAMRYLGDVLLATPLMRAVREHYPDCTIEALVLQGTESMLEGNPDIAAVHSLPEKPDRGTLGAMVRKLWRRYDIALVTQPGDKPHLLGWAAAPVRYGLVPEKRSQSWWKRLLLTSPLVTDMSLHRVLEGERIARAMGIAQARKVVAPAPVQPPQEWPALHTEASSDRFDPERPYAVVHPTPRRRYKQWTPQGWQALLNWLAERELQILVTGGPGPGETQYVDTLLQDLPAATRRVVIRAQGRLTLAQTAHLLRGARLYVGPDTATTHLAAACATPTVALYGPTDPRLWGPWPGDGQAPGWKKAAPVQRRSNVTLLQNPARSCVPCQQEGCDRHRESLSHCLETLSIETVLDAVAEHLGHGAPGASVSGGAA
ncbi:MAG: glycosyltransferase family 9 protein [Pigmentiphaga sp.]|uniref:glycosyltransferase family 9 protein n=1 Tax=Pigmentiphaga sp. TaxID=1977564 RepID=UPI0029A918DD|nr:glycosyltransferase family 9 protein [Pigmentiphaga sp.]MDX3904354.1 glycosyltransferase family 9 protein [Pigmentiphaga sp.]